MVFVSGICAMILSNMSVADCSCPVSIVILLLSKMLKLQNTF